MAFKITKIDPPPKEEKAAFDLSQYASPPGASRFPKLPQGTPISRYRGRFPVLVDDGHGGTLMYVRQKGFICRHCGQPAGDMLRLYTWAGTRNPELLGYGYGSWVKNVYTACDACGDCEAS